MESNYKKFVELNRALLDCYGAVRPNHYVLLEPSVQKDVCYGERTRVEEFLTKG